MITITSDNLTGIISISDIYTTSAAPILLNTGDTYVMSFINLKKVKYFSNLSYTVSGNTEYRHITAEYRVSKDSEKWTEWISIPVSTTISPTYSTCSGNIMNFIPFDPKYDMFIDVRWTRSGDSNTGNLSLLSYNLTGHLDRPANDGISTVSLNTTNRELVIKPPYIFKIFKITDIEILSKNDIDNTVIYYRYSQDNGRTISNWVELTKENLRSERINPIRFFQIEYYVRYNGTSKVSINDINLIGDFQNVTLDGQKTNLYGVRENCNCLILQIVNDASVLEKTQVPTSMLLANNTTDLYKLTPTDKSVLYDPYQQNAALALLNKLSNDSVSMFGHDVVYVLTDPDKNGTDFTFHEYQLQNYVCQNRMKVSVDNNQFPDNQITLNQFDLSLFDIFEIHVTKEDFKTAFGVEKRPGVNDIVWFCNLNRLYRIEHAQPFKNFNNSVIYYKIILKKANTQANIIGATQEIEDAINSLTDNSTIGELLGLENSQDKKAVANTEQLRSLAQDTLRVEIYSARQKETIENASNIISKTNYDLSTVGNGEAVVYRNFKNFFQKSDNIGFMCWFNINTISAVEPYNFFNYGDDDNNIKINMLGTNILVEINGTTHILAFASLLSENIWYSLVVNLDQRDKLLSAFIYKRDVEYEEDAPMLSSSKLLLLYKITKPITPRIIEIPLTMNASILGSDMSITNIRMFIDIIPESEHNKMLNREILGSDYKYIIFSDNANKKLELPFYTDSKVAYDKIRRGTDLDI
jgi:hypothetical protein